MRIKNKNEFGDLGTAVIYKFHKFIPDIENPGPKRSIDSIVASIDSDDPSYFKPEKILYHGGTKRFDNISFAEYDFSYILENQKFNNRDLISYLDQETRDNVGKNLGSLEKINSALFPTISGSSRQIEYDYFGSLTLSSSTVYLFNLDPLCYKIEIYEDSIDKNNSGEDSNFLDIDYLKIVDPEKILVEPVVTIYLGPVDTLQNNPPSMYYDEDNWSTISNRPVLPIDSLEYSKLYDEIFAGKTVWLILSPNNTLQQLNLSFAAWNSSDNANRYKHLHNLRNDDYYSANKFDIVKRNPYNKNIFNDVRNGKLLATKAGIDYPILNKKLRVVESWGDKYDPAVEYKVGSTVNFNGSEYTAVRKNNRGKYPGSSICWVLKDKLTDYYTTRITLIDDPVEGGYTVPSRQITLKTKEIMNGQITADPMVFKVISHPGYSNENSAGSHTDEIYIETTSTSDPRLELINLVDYTAANVISDTGINQYRLVTITETGWSKILGESSRERIIFKFRESPIQNTLIYNIGSGKKNVVIGDDITSETTYFRLTKIKINDQEFIDNIDTKLSNLVKDDILSFWLELVDPTETFIYRSTELIKTIQGSLVSSSVSADIIDSTHIEIKDVIISDCTSFCIKLTGSDRRYVTFDFFDDFEVEHINSEVLLNNSFQTRFYGTYNDNFAYVQIGDVRIDLNSHHENYHLTKLDSMYTLVIDEVTEDLTIEIYNNKTKPYDIR